MVDTSPVMRVKGTNDVLMSELAHKQQLQAQLTEHFALYGYKPIETPIIEHSELYLRKSGEDIVARMYEFEYRNRRLCLRPELTASAVRAYVDNFQDFPLPLRLSYAGPVFRYERPQHARYRQFTQVGVELIGTQALSDNDSRSEPLQANPEALADAELISMACDFLDKIGIDDYSVVLGNVELLFSFLKQLELQGQMQNFLMLNMENLRKDGKARLVEKLQQMNPSFHAMSDADITAAQTNATTDDTTKLTDILRGMSAGDARSAVSDFLTSLNIQIDSSRDHTEIIDRLLVKIKQEDDVPILNQAIGFMEKLGALVGTYDDVLPKAYALLDEYDMNPSPLQKFEQLIQNLLSHGVDADKLVVDLGLSRGLQYYTGMVFEIHDKRLGDSSQLCGGGRYDDLVQLLGGRQSLDATGFSFGLERLLLAIQNKADAASKLPHTDVLIVSLNADDMPYTIDVSQQLRAAGIRVELAMRSRSIRNHLQYADKADIPYVIVIGENERANQQLTLRDMDAHDENTMDIAAAIASIKDNAS